MNFATALELGAVGAIVLGVLTLITRKLREREERGKLDQELRLQSLKPIQEQIAKLESTSLKDTESYRLAKEKYDEKYRNRNSNPPSKQ